MRQWVDSRVVAINFLLHSHSQELLSHLHQGSISAEAHRWMLFLFKGPTEKTTTDGWQILRPADNRHLNL